MTGGSDDRALDDRRLQVRGRQDAGATASRAESQWRATVGGSPRRRASAELTHYPCLTQRSDATDGSYPAGTRMQDVMTCEDAPHGHRPYRRILHHAGGGTWHWRALVRSHPSLGFAAYNGVDCALASQIPFASHSTARSHSPDPTTHDMSVQLRSIRRLTFVSYPCPGCTGQPMFSAGARPTPHKWGNYSHLRDSGSVRSAEVLPGAASQQPQLWQAAIGVNSWFAAADNPHDGSTMQDCCPPTPAHVPNAAWHTVSTHDPLSLQVVSIPPFVSPMLAPLHCAEPPVHAFSHPLPHQGSGDRIGWRRCLRC